MKPIYLDYAATTPVGEGVLAAAEPYFRGAYYNAASMHFAGQFAHRAVEAARQKCADAIGAYTDEIYFTSGGTEAVNLAMKGVDLAGRKHIVVSEIEHDSVLACAKYLENNGYEVDYVYPDSDGIITPAALEKKLRPDTGLVAVMSVNNIVGTVQPVKELAEAAHAVGALFFTDAVQAVNTVDISVASTAADMLCVSAHKFYGMKGAGFLFARRDIKFNPLISGGLQENGVRGGTQNVPAIVAMGRAIEDAASNRKSYNAHAKEVVRAFIDNLSCGRVIAEKAPRASDITSVVFDGVKGGELAIALSMRGVCCSVGSACSAGSATPPKTLIAMGERGAFNSVRFSFGRDTTVDEATEAAKIVNDAVAKLKASGDSE